MVSPKGTNTAKPDITPMNDEDKTLWACNTWLLTHADGPEAGQGAPIRIDGEDLDIAADL